MQKNTCTDVVPVLVGTGSSKSNISNHGSSEFWFVQSSLSWGRLSDNRQTFPSRETKHNPSLHLIHRHIIIYLKWNGHLTRLASL